MKTSLSFFVTRSALLLALISSAQISLGQTTEQTRRALTDLRSDRIPHNCERAAKWLLQNSASLKDQLLEELYKTQTDPQTRDAILHILFNTPSFAMDERFRRFVMARLPEQNRQVKSGSIFDTPFEPEAEHLSWDGTHFEAWKYINAHFDTFEPLLRAEIGTSENVWVLWSAGWLLKKRGVLDQFASLFTPEVLARVAANLKDDKKDYNASQAVRLFLLLGDQSIPTLREAAKTSDAQARDLARATLDALKGNRSAFGFLNARVNLTEVLFGQKQSEPHWLDEAGEPYYENKKPYAGR